MNNLGVNAVKNSLADLADLCFGWIDEAACRVVIEIWFVIFEGYECFCNFFERDLASSSMEFATLGFTFL